MKIKKIPINDDDYVEFYAENLRENKIYFKQYKELIDSQIIASKSLFKNKFHKDFKNKARSYLKKVGILKPII